MTSSPTLRSDVETVTQNLLAYCRDNDWAGYDPYDALNSRLFESFPMLDSKIPRLVMTQLLKRSPINIRPLLQIPKTQNPKAIALFISALLKSPDLAVNGQEDLVEKLLGRIVALRSTGTPYWNWGYSFAWQTRTIIVKRAMPNLVCTTFVANTLLDLYEQRPRQEYLEMATSAAEYILNELYWTEGESVAGFSYPLASLRVQVHNANFLAAALFCRIYRHTGDERFVSPALKVARYSAGKQQADGSWYYGEADTQRWIDNFHTGYNLSGLRQINKYLETDEFEPHIRAGFEFYKAHFFREDGAARYFHDRTYPIDIHCVAQSILTPLEFQELGPESVSLAHSAARWAIDHMWDERGFFYYRVLRLATIRTSYMRWSQAWMLLAMSTLRADMMTKAKSSQPAVANMVGQPA